MLYLRHAVTVVLSAMLLAPVSSKAAEKVGQAVLIKTEVTGAGGPLTADDPVHRDERIRTSLSGLGQFTFRDGTKLAVGAGSSVVIDKFVFDNFGLSQKAHHKGRKGHFSLDERKFKLFCVSNRDARRNDRRARDGI